MASPPVRRARSPRSLGLIKRASSAADGKQHERAAALFTEALKLCADYTSLYNNRCVCTHARVRSLTLMNRGLQTGHCSRRGLIAQGASVPAAEQARSGPQRPRRGDRVALLGSHHAQTGALLGVALPSFSCAAFACAAACDVACRASFPCVLLFLSAANKLAALACRAVGYTAAQIPSFVSWA